MHARTHAFLSASPGILDKHLKRLMLIDAPFLVRAAGVLQSLAYPAGGGGDDEEGSTGMCRVCAVGILSTVAAKWGPSGEAGGKDPSFLLLTLRVLFAFVLCPPRGPVRAGEWCR